MKFKSILITLLLSVAMTFSASADDSDQVVYRFAFVGCNRVGFEVDSGKNPSTANVQQLNNTLREIAATSPKPTYLFFLGDMVRGYTTGLDVTEQLKAWRALYRRSPIARSGITLVPVVGNHEMLVSGQDPETKEWTDYPNPAAALAWKDIMRPYLKWRDGPDTSEPNLDSLTMSQEDLSFTVRDENILFILLNTDTYIDNVTIGDIPLHWLEEKLAEGQADPEIEHIFVMGHKPLMKAEVDGTIVREEEAGPAIELLSKHSKVRGFLAAHVHLWNYQVLPGGVPQVINGNGGSTLKGSFLDPEIGYYGYTLVDIMESGKIVIESWGRPVPDPYDSDLPQPKATLRQTHILDQR